MIRNGIMNQREAYCLSYYILFWRLHDKAMAMRFYVVKGYDFCFLAIEDK